jgi:hypothetical protein
LISGCKENVYYNDEDKATDNQEQLEDESTSIDSADSDSVSNSNSSQDENSVNNSSSSSSIQAQKVGLDFNTIDEVSNSKPILLTDETGNKFLQSSIVTNYSNDGTFSFSLGRKVRSLQNNSKTKKLNSLRSIKSYTDDINISDVYVSVYRSTEQKLDQVALSKDPVSGLFFGNLPNLPLNEDLEFEFEFYEYVFYSDGSGVTNRFAISKSIVNISSSGDGNFTIDSNVSEKPRPVTPAPSLSKPEYILTSEGNISIEWFILHNYNASNPVVGYELNISDGYEQYFSNNLSGDLYFYGQNYTYLDFNYSIQNDVNVSGFLSLFYGDQEVTKSYFEVIPFSNGSDGNSSTVTNVTVAPNFNFVFAPRVTNITKITNLDGTTNLKVTTNLDEEDSRDGIYFQWSGYEDENITTIDENGTLFIPSYFYDEENLTLTIIKSFGDLNATSTYHYFIDLSLNEPKLRIQNFEREVQNGVNFHNESWNTNQFIVDGNYSYHANGKNGFAIADISEANSSKIISFIETDFSVNYIQKFENLLYIAGDTFIQTYDVSNPVEPNLYWKFNELNSTIYDLKISPDGNNLAIKNNNNKNLVIYDISTKKRPEIIGEITDYRINYYDLSNDAIFIQSYIYTSGVGSSYYLKTYSIDNLNLESTISLIRNSSGFKYINGFIYLFNYNKINVYNVSDIENPYLVNIFDIWTYYNKHNLNQNIFYSHNRDWSNPAIQRTILTQTENNVTAEYNSFDIPLENYEQGYNFQVQDNLVYLVDGKIIDINKSIENNKTIYAGKIADLKELNLQPFEDIAVRKKANSLDFELLYFSDKTAPTVTDSFDVSTLNLFDENKTDVNISNGSISQNYVILADNNSTGNCCEYNILTRLHIFDISANSLNYSGFIEINGTIEYLKIEDSQAYVLTNYGDYNDHNFYSLDLENLTVESNSSLINYWFQDLKIKDENVYIPNYDEVQVKPVSDLSQNIETIYTSSNYAIKLAISENILVSAGSSGIKVFEINENNGSLNYVSTFYENLDGCCQFPTVEIYGDYVFVKKTTDNKAKIKVIDISNIYEPKLLNFDIPTSNYFDSFIIEGNYLYTYIRGTVKDIIYINTILK